MNDIVKLEFTDPITGKVSIMYSNLEETRLIEEYEKQRINILWEIFKKYAALK